MKRYRIRGVSRAMGEVVVPGDKSISHRAAMLAALAQGTSVLHNYLVADDSLHTLECLRALSVEYQREDRRVEIHGKGLTGLQPPIAALDVGNSGTAIRLLTGILAGQKFVSTITGDDSICHRPMRRVIEPLRQMGARIEAAVDDNFPPLTVQGGSLKPIRYELPIASAQVKSAILLAGLYVEGGTEAKEPVPLRDHTERLMQWFGIPIRTDGFRIQVSGHVLFSGKEVNIPHDISSAAFFIALGLLARDGQIRCPGVGCNPRRTEFLNVLKQMGGNLEIRPGGEDSGEPVGDVESRSSKLHGVTMGEAVIPSVIDEIPILAVAAASAEGVTDIREALELRVKESDRIAAIVELLQAFGVKVEERVDGMRIYGAKHLKGARVSSHGDHRIAMAATIAGLVAKGETVVEGVECVDTSFPGFAELIQKVCGVDALQVI